MNLRPSADFISYSLPATFLADLNAEIAAFETAVNAQSSNISDRIEAHAELANAISDGLILKRTLDPLVRNIFASDPGKIAAWASAAHVEKLLRKRKKSQFQKINPKTIFPMC